VCHGFSTIERGTVCLFVRGVEWIEVTNSKDISDGLPGAMVLFFLKIFVKFKWLSIGVHELDFTPKEVAWFFVVSFLLAPPCVSHNLVFGKGDGTDK